MHVFSVISTKSHIPFQWVYKCPWIFEMLVCVCVWERARERDKGLQIHWKTETLKSVVLRANCSHYIDKIINAIIMRPMRQQEIGFSAPRPLTVNPPFLMSGRHEGYHFHLWVMVELWHSEISSDHSDKLKKAWWVLAMNPDVGSFDDPLNPG